MKYNHAKADTERAGDITFGLYRLIDYVGYSVNAYDGFICVTVKGPVLTDHADMLKMRGWEMVPVRSMAGKPTKFEDWEYSL